MKRVLLTAGGTATAWHMVNVANEFFGDDVEIHIGDINDRYLVPSATLVDNYFKTPYISEDDYYGKMLEYMIEKEIDYIIPLIDDDLFIWNRDNKDLLDHNIKTTGPNKNTVDVLTDKECLVNFLNEHNLPTPQIVEYNRREKNKQYILKKKVGCGSQGMKIISGDEQYNIDDSMLLQEMCNDGNVEITAEIFNTSSLLKVFCRERVATKSGVCVKMVPVYEPEIEDYIAKLVKAIPCPEAFCAQFMKHNGRWCMIDCNLRMGAGTALSTKIGFQLTRAFWANILDKKIDEKWFEYDKSIKSVLRVYEEIIVR